RPRSSQVWKKGDQSMKGTRAESEIAECGVRSAELKSGLDGVSTLRSTATEDGSPHRTGETGERTRTPMKSGCGRSPKVNFGARLRASSIEMSFICWPACWARMRSYSLRIA